MPRHRSFCATHFFIHKILLSPVALQPSTPWLKQRKKRNGNEIARRGPMVNRFHCHAFVFKQLLISAVSSSSSSSSESDSDSSPPPARENSQREEQNKVKPSETPSSTSPASSSPNAPPPPPPEASSSKEPSSEDSFDEFYLKQATNEFANDLDKLRSAGDFNEKSVPILIEGLKQGRDCFTPEERKRIVEGS